MRRLRADSTARRRPSGRSLRGTTHQAVSALAGLTYCHAATPSLQQGAATTIALIGAARLPDQLEFRYFLNGVRRLMRPFQPRRLPNGEMSEPTMLRRAWDRTVLKGGSRPSKAFVMRFHIRHRGPTHWAPTGLLAAFAVFLLAAMIVDTEPYALHIGIGFLIGYLLHPVLDAPNELPVEIWPRHETHLCWPRRLRVRSCGLADTLLAMVCVGLCVWLAVGLLPEGPLIEAGGR